MVDSIVPRDFEFALPLEPPAHDPKRARQLLAEARFPNAFDGGEITPFPPYNAMGEAIAGWLSEQVTQAPIYHLGFPTGVRPRVDNIMATAISGFYLSPYEDLKLKRPWAWRGSIRLSSKRLVHGIFVHGIQ